MKIKNLGPINEADINLGKLTIFCGGNNQGKTYASYALYGLLSSVSRIVNDIFDREEINLLINYQKIEYDFDEFVVKLANIFIEKYSKNEADILSNTFRNEEAFFGTSSVEINIEEAKKFFSGFNNIEEMKGTINKDKDLFFQLKNNKKKISILLYGDLEKNTLVIEELSEILDEVIRRSIKQIFTSFYVPAERIGINVFRAQLNENKIETLDALSSIIQLNGYKNSSLKNEFKKETIKKFINVLSETNLSYPTPISHYLDYINSIEEYGSKNEEDVASAIIRDKILNGKFDVNSNNNQSYFRLKYGNKRYKKEQIPLQITSSSIKSMYGLDNYLETLNELNGNYLIIDEPEMNLHPSNQAEMAVVLDQMIRKGLNVIISTHSDFLIKKIQNIILKNELALDSEGISRKNVCIYDFKNGTVNLIDLFDDQSVFENFNSTIVDLEDEFLDLLDALSERN